MHLTISKLSLCCLARLQWLQVSRHLVSQSGLRFCDHISEIQIFHGLPEHFRSGTWEQCVWFRFYKMLDILAFFDKVFGFDIARIGGGKDVEKFINFRKHTPLMWGSISFWGCTHEYGPSNDYRNSWISWLTVIVYRNHRRWRNLLMKPLGYRSTRCEVVIWKMVRIATLLIYILYHFVISLTRWPMCMMVVLSEGKRRSEKRKEGKWGRWSFMTRWLDGGFKHFSFSPLFGEDFQFD